MFAFARKSFNARKLAIETDIALGDGGTPFPKWISRISPKYNVPINAVYVTGLFSFILSLIYIGSPTAFYAITSLFTVALLQCYMFSIGSILWRRIYLPDTIPKGHFSLGRWGLPINAMALVWCMWSFVSFGTLGVQYEDYADPSTVLVLLADLYPDNSGRLQLGIGHLRCGDLGLHSSLVWYVNKSSPGSCEKPELTL